MLMICSLTAIFILTVTFWINCSDFAFSLPSSSNSRKYYNNGKENFIHTFLIQFLTVIFFS